MNNINTSFPNQMPESNSAYSDLIYLFLDKEATQTEIDVLFMELSRNPVLQKEFQDVASFYALAGATANSYLPPADLAQSVFSAVGVQLAATTAPVATSNLYSSIQNTFTSLLSSGIAKSIAYICIGAGITVATPWIYNQIISSPTKLSATSIGNTIPLNSKQDNSLIQPDIRQHTTPPFASETEQTNSIDKPNSQAGTNTAQQINGNSANKSTNQNSNTRVQDDTDINQNSVSSNSVPNRYSSSHISSRSSHTESSHAHNNSIKRNSTSSAHLNNSTTNISTSNSESSHTIPTGTNTNDSQASLLTTTVSPNELQEVVSTNREYVYGAERIITLNKFTPMGVKRGFSLTSPDYMIVGTSLSLLQLPVRDYSPTVQPEGHCEILWSLSDNIYVGIGGGSEQFPYYNVLTESDGRKAFIPRENQAYVGLSARYKSSLSSLYFLPEWLQAIDAHTSLLIGATNRGFYNRVGASLSYPVLTWLDVQLNSSFSLLVFNETSADNSNTVVRGAQRVGVGFGLGIKL
jgi:hypothetical protein